MSCHSTPCASLSIFFANEWICSEGHAGLTGDSGGLATVNRHYVRSIADAEYQTDVRPHPRPRRIGVGGPSGHSAVLASSLLVFPIHLLRVANDLVIAGPRSRAHDPPCSDCHGPALACDVGAVNANRTGNRRVPSSPTRTPLVASKVPHCTALTVRQDVHCPGSGNRRGTNRVKRSASA